MRKTDQSGCSAPLILLASVLLMLPVRAVSNQNLDPPSHLHVTIHVRPGCEGADKHQIIRESGGSLCVSDIERAFGLYSALKSSAGGKFTSAVLTIQLSPGTHHLSAPLEISGDQDRAVKVRMLGRPGRTVVTGAKMALPSPSVDASKCAYETPALGLPVGVARGLGHVISSAVPIVKIGGELRGAARWPMTGYANIEKVSPLPGGAFAFHLKGFDQALSDTESSIRAVGYFHHAWSAHEVAIVSGSDANGSVSIPKDGLPNYGLRDGGRAALLNSASFLRRHGDWAYDSRLRRFTVLKGADHQSCPELTYSSVGNLFKLKGAANWTFQDIHFEMASSTLFLVESSENIIFERVRFSSAGGLGLSVRKSTAVHVRNAVFEDLGEGGVELIGGDRLTLTGSRNSIQDSSFRRTNNQVPTYRPAIRIDGVGVKVEGNEISDLPHSAIMFQGNNHIIANNKISRVVTEASDSGAIYTGRDWTAQGTVIVDNLLADVIPWSAQAEVKGIYLDDQASGVTIAGNSFVNVTQPVFIGGGRSIEVRANSFVNSIPSVHIDARGLTWQIPNSSAAGKTLLDAYARMPVSSTAWRAQYPELHRLLDDELGVPKYIKIEANRYGEGPRYRIHPSVKVEILD